MNAPPWPLNPDVGQMFQNWVWTGSQWMATPITGLRVLTQVFRASGSYMPSPGLISLVVECIGGGGGGGLVLNPAGGNVLIAGGGGGSGGYSRTTIPAVLVRGGVPVTVGLGGDGSAIGAGQHGGDTMFGALCVARGGGGGVPNNDINVFGDGGAGGSPGIGAVAMPGNSGGAGAQQSSPSLNIAAAGGIGAAIWGGANLALHVGNGGSMPGANAWDGTGAGGNGGVINQATQASAPEVNGGNGGSGLCVVTETCWGDRDIQPPTWNINANILGGPPCPPWPPSCR